MPGQDRRLAQAAHTCMLVVLAHAQVLGDRAACVPGAAAGGAEGRRRHLRPGCRGGGSGQRHQECKGTHPDVAVAGACCCLLGAGRLNVAYARARARSSLTGRACVCVCVDVLQVLQGEQQINKVLSMLVNPLR